MSTISVNGMEFYAYHGCFEEEQKIGNRFIVDIHAEADIRKASLSDDLSKTINYQELYKICKHEMEIPSKLIEHVAQRILVTIRNKLPLITYAKITIHKLNPPIGGKMESVSVSMNSDETE